MSTVRGADGLLCEGTGYELAVCADRVAGNDEAGDDIPLPSSIEGAVRLGKERDAINIVSDLVYPSYAADINIVDRLCFHKRRYIRRTQGGALPAGFVDFVADRGAKHVPIVSSNHISPRNVRFQQFSGKDGECLVSACLGATNLPAPKAKRTPKEERAVS